MEHQPVLVDQVVAHQRLGELAAADDLEVLSGLLLELGDRLGDVALEQTRVAPRQGSSRVVEATYFGRLFRVAAMGSSSGCVGQNPANSS